jgi:hypothetical protein
MVHGDCAFRACAQLGVSAAGTCILSAVLPLGSDLRPSKQLHAQRRRLQLGPDEWYGSCITRAALSQAIMTAVATHCIMDAYLSDNASAGRWATSNLPLAWLFCSGQSFRDHPWRHSQSTGGVAFWTDSANRKNSLVCLLAEFIQKVLYLRGRSGSDYMPKRTRAAGR